MKYKEVNDDSIAGETWFYVETLEIFKRGLEDLLEEISKYETMIKELELDETPYDKDKRTIERMIQYIDGELKKTQGDYDAKFTWIDSAYKSKEKAELEKSKYDAVITLCETFKDSDNEDEYQSYLQYQDCRPARIIAIELK